MDKPTEIYTAIGTLPTDFGEVVNEFVGYAISIGAVATMFLLAFGGITILTSAGDPEKLMNGREIITNAIMGLIVIVLAVFIVSVLGGDILQIEYLKTFFISNK